MYFECCSKRSGRLHIPLWMDGCFSRVNVCYGDMCIIQVLQYLGFY